MSHFDQEFGPTLKRHHLTALPPYLILHIKRFTKNNFVEERNPTVVNFPLRGVELSDCEYIRLRPNKRRADDQMSILNHLIPSIPFTISCPVSPWTLQPPLPPRPVRDQGSARRTQQRRTQCRGRFMSGQDKAEEMKKSGTRCRICESKRSAEKWCFWAKRSSRFGRGGTCPRQIRLRCRCRFQRLYTCMCNSDMRPADGSELIKIKARAWAWNFD